MRTAYPTGDDLAAYLTQAGLDPAPFDGDDLQDAAEAGRQLFERQANRVMLAGSSETRSVDPASTSDGVVVLPWDVAVLASVAWQPSGSTSTPWTEGTDYITLPQNAASQGKPITMFQLSGRSGWGYSPLSYVGAVKITGRFGYATAIPGLAWRGMLALGAMQMFGQMGQAGTDAASGGLVSYQAGTYREEFGKDGWLGVFTAQCQSTAQDAVKAYRRVTL